MLLAGAPPGSSRHFARKGGPELGEAVAACRAIVSGRRVCSWSRTTGGRPADWTFRSGFFCKLNSMPRTISIGPSSSKIAKLTNARLTVVESQKVDAFLGLHGKVLDKQTFEDFVNGELGDANCEKLTGKNAQYSVRLAGKHRICFTVKLETQETLHITITAIGDPTYKH